MCSMFLLSVGAINCWAIFEVWSLSRACGHTHFRSGCGASYWNKLVGFIFAVQDESTKTMRIMHLENLVLYNSLGRLVCTGKLIPVTCNAPIVLLPESWLIKYYTPSLAPSTNFIPLAPTTAHKDSSLLQHSTAYCFLQSCTCGLQNSHVYGTVLVQSPGPCRALQSRWLEFWSPGHTSQFLDYMHSSYHGFYRTCL